MRPVGSESGLRLGVDVGGTFTDVVAVDNQGGVHLAKVLSTPRDQSDGVLDGWTVLADQVGVSGEDVAVFAHGTTVATNALLERQGGRTALITTEGFADIIEIGRQDRASLYDLTRHRPAPLVPRNLRFTVRERVGPDGVIVPLDDESLAAVVEEVSRADVDAVAVCLLFGFLHPEHEQIVGSALRERLPGVAVSLSHEVLAEFREYERTSTTVADAYLRPRLADYLSHLGRRAAETKLPEPAVMQSSGGVMDVAAAARHPARFVLSGPAGGVVGASHVAQLSGFTDVLTFDMGGTSTDVASVVDGAAQLTTESVVAGVPLRLPMVDVHTVSAGGGSIGWIDGGGALRVGPRSAGAEPGPACYDRGGTEPTVTDANLVLGLLPDRARLGGDVVLRRELAVEALKKLGFTLGLTAQQVALGMVRVADTEMVRALRVISVERGLDPRGFAIVAFGGAGGLHACSLAEELGSSVVLIPRAAGVLSALGLAICDVRHDHAVTFARREDSELEGSFTRLETVALEELPTADLKRLADLRYAGQSFELTVPGGTREGLEAAFAEAHEQRYGHRMDGEEIEIVNLRVVASRPGLLPDLRGVDRSVRSAAGTADSPPMSRRIFLDGGEVEAVVLDHAGLTRRGALTGPAIIEMPEATCLVRPGWSGVVDDVGTLVLRRDQGGAR